LLRTSRWRLASRLVIDMKLETLFILLSLAVTPTMVFAQLGVPADSPPPPSSSPTTRPFRYPSLRPLVDVQMRDVSICLGGDGNYYLTGTTGKNIWVQNDGIELWRSPDLKTWEPMGFVWLIERDGTWQKQWTKKVGRDGKEFDRRSVWAPEIHYFKNNYYLAYCITGLGTGVLRSTTGKPEGPYAPTHGTAGPLTKGIDASLFCDDDGSVYFAWGSGWYVKLNDDLSALAGDPIMVHCNPPDLDPANHHGSKYCPDMTHVGFEGAFLFKANGKYHMACAERPGDGRYSCFIASADSLAGPWGARYEAVPCGGHNVFFQDKQGNWWSTLFGNDREVALRERPAILPVVFGNDGRISVAPEACK
jgi:beta-xylosidase